MAPQRQFGSIPNYPVGSGSMEEIDKHIHLATEYSNKGDHDLAIKELEYIVALDPDDEFTYFMMALQYYKNGNYEVALEWINRSVELLEIKFVFDDLKNFDQTDKEVIAEIFSKRSEIRVKLGYNPDDTGCILLLDDLTKAIELCPENAQYLTVRSEINLAILRPGLALEDIEKAAELEPNDSYILSVLHDAFRQLELYRTYKSSSETINLIDKGEGNQIEFKSSFSLNLETQKKRDIVIETTSLKTLVAFLNTRGGDLIIGIEDDTSVFGIHKDGFKSEDAYKRKIAEQVRVRIGPEFGSYLDYIFDEYQDEIILRIHCDMLPENQVAFLDGKLYIRNSSESVELSTKQAIDWQSKRQ